MRDVEISEMGDKKRKRIPGLKPHVEKVKEIRTEGLGPGNRSKKIWYIYSYLLLQIRVHQGTTLFHHKLLRHILLPCNMQIFDLCTFHKWDTK